MNVYIAEKYDWTSKLFHPVVRCSQKHPIIQHHGNIELIWVILTGTSSHPRVSKAGKIDKEAGGFICCFKARPSSVFY